MVWSDYLLGVDAELDDRHVNIFPWLSLSRLARKVSTMVLNNLTNYFRDNRYGMAHTELA